MISDSIIYRINEFYKYPNKKKKYKLKEVDGCVFKFHCSHWCTDNVFIDLIRCSTGTHVFEDNQTMLKL